MKYLKQKLIKGKLYYYFEYPLVSASKKRTYTRYLGADFPSDLVGLFSTYFKEIAAIVANDVDVGKNFLPGSASVIELARFRYVLLNHELFQRELELFKTLFYILFVLNSNRAEGSKVTRPDIEEVMNKRVKPKTVIEKEVVNSMDAINFSFSNGMKWNEKSIRVIHKYLFDNIHPEIAGKYKKVNNVVGNSLTTPWTEVGQEMKRLLLWFNKNRKKTYPPQLALEFYWRFEAIHPFEDGNGRVGRILLNAILISRGYAPVIFFSENHSAHCNAIEKARQGRSAQLAKHFIDSVKKTASAIDKYKAEGIITGGSRMIGRWELQKGKIRLG